jgi:hypothetical protein
MKAVVLLSSVLPDLSGVWAADDTTSTTFLWSGRGDIPLQPAARELYVGRMDLTFTVDNPNAYTRPWSITMKFELLPDTDLLEYLCDNDKWASSRARPR